MGFYAVANLTDMYDGFRQAFRAGGKSLLLIQDQDRHYIIENRCPHMDAPLASGTVASSHITCKAHGIAFSLLDGRAQGPLANVIENLAFFPVHYEGSKIGVFLNGNSL